MADLIASLPGPSGSSQGGISVSALPAESAELPGAEPEPVYGPDQRADIQGNIIPGFNKDHQHFLFLRMGSIERTKEWLRWIAPLISSLDDVLSFTRSHRALRLRLGVRQAPLSSTWINIGLSHTAIAALTSEADADAFGETAFREGLSQRSTLLGDPTDPQRAGHRKNWLVGGPDNEADILVIVAADQERHLKSTVSAIADKADSLELGLVYEQRCDALPGDLAGHEHFGFKDGISQPGVRGKVSGASGDFITPRYLDPADDRARFYSKPGQLLLWPGQFLLGEPRQDTESLTDSAPAASNFPTWARGGSYLVCRRLRQNVPAFWTFVVAAAAATGVPPVKLASMFVGRWPSGAPLMRSPNADNPDLAKDQWANNHFIFDDNTRPSQLKEIPGYEGDQFDPAVADVLGNVCPHFSHIRRVNPRDTATDLGKPHDSMLRMIMRRGIPFGPPIVGVQNPSEDLLQQDRGLMFVCYGSTIEDQFEFLSRRWSNSTLQPNSGGHDPIIGQADRRGVRDRFVDFPGVNGPQRLPLPVDWVTPTGGGYFFAPPVSALTDVLGAH